MRYFQAKPSPMHAGLFLCMCMYVYVCVYIYTDTVVALSCLQIKKVLGEKNISTCWGVNLCVLFRAIYVHLGE